MLSDFWAAWLGVFVAVEIAAVLGSWAGGWPPSTLSAWARQRLPGWALAGLLAWLALHLLGGAQSVLAMSSSLVFGLAGAWLGPRLIARAAGACGRRWSWLAILRPPSRPNG